MGIFDGTPVGMPGLVILGLGFLSFALAVTAARIRRSRMPQAGDSGRANASWLWVLVQGFGLFIVAFAPVRPTLVATSGAAIGQAIVTFLLCAAAVGLFHWSSRTMGANWAVVARTRSDHSLVTTGPFAWMRNPIYVALFLLMLAMAVAYGHLRNLLIGIPIYAVGTWFRVRHEERLLRRQFGEEYDRYAAKVARFIPGVF